MYLNESFESNASGGKRERLLETAKAVSNASSTVYQKYAHVRIARLLHEEAVGISPEIMCESGMELYQNMVMDTTGRGVSGVSEPLRRYLSRFLWEMVFRHAEDERAVRLASRIAKAGGYDTALSLDMASFLQETKREKIAENVLKMAWAKAPDSQEIHLALCEGYMREGCLDEATRLAQHVLSLEVKKEPENRRHDVSCRAADVLYEAGVSIFNRAMVLKQRDLVERGFSSSGGREEWGNGPERVSKQEPEQWSVLLKKAVDIMAPSVFVGVHDDNGTASKRELALGACYYEMGGELSRADFLLELAAQNMTCAVLEFYRGGVRFKKGQYEEAVPFFDKAKNQAFHEGDVSLAQQADVYLRRAVNRADPLRKQRDQSYKAPSVDPRIEILVPVSN